MFLNNPWVVPMKETFNWGQKIKNIFSSVSELPGEVFCGRSTLERCPNDGFPFYLGLAYKTF